MAAPHYVCQSHLACSQDANGLDFFGLAKATPQAIDALLENNLLQDRGMARFSLSASGERSFLNEANKNDSGAWD